MSLMTQIWNMLMQFGFKQGRLMLIDVMFMFSANEKSYYFSFSLIYCTLSSPNVFVTANPHPCSKALLIIAALVVGGAEARPNGFGNFIPQTSMLVSTWSIALKNNGSFGTESTVCPYRDFKNKRELAESFSTNIINMIITNVIYDECFCCSPAYVPSFYLPFLSYLIRRIPSYGSGPVQVCLSTVACLGVGYLVIRTTQLVFVDKFI